jgi:steroid 5-alpha reductase family enzyme
MMVSLENVSALSAGLWVVGGSTVIVWVLSLVTSDHSWVDRIWSIIPVVYLWIFTGSADLADTRLDVMAVLVTLWGARLTFNFARKGGYARGGEDYRWAVLRGRMTNWQFQLFNLFFISAYQNALLFAITLPAWTAATHQGGFGLLDALATVVFLILLAGETLADQQQWSFHQRKRAESDAGRPFGVGFLRTGLFRYSRHPNYFCEIAIWWVIFAFAAIAAGSLAQWTIIGAVLLTLLFIGSTVFTESISASKYPEYANYRRQVSPIVPWFPRRVAEHRTSHA